MKAMITLALFWFVVMLTGSVQPSRLWPSVLGKEKVKRLRTHATQTAQPRVLD